MQDRNVRPQGDKQSFWHKARRRALPPGAGRLRARHASRHELPDAVACISQDLIHPCRPWCAMRLRAVKGRSWPLTDALVHQVPFDVRAGRFDVGESLIAWRRQSAKSDLKKPSAGEFTVMVRQAYQHGNEPVLGKNQQTVFIVAVSYAHRLKCQVQCPLGSRQGEGKSDQTLPSPPDLPNPEWSGRPH